MIRSLKIKFCSQGLGSKTQCLLLHCRCQGTDGPSGYGFELTFRLKREPGETNPPTWPATLMQALARYVFQTG